RLIVAGGNNPALARITTDRQRPIAQPRVVTHLDSGEEAIAIDVDDLAQGPGPVPGRYAGYCTSDDDHPITPFALAAVQPLVHPLQRLDDIGFVVPHLGQGKGSGNTARLALEYHWRVFQGGAQALHYPFGLGWPGIRQYNNEFLATEAPYHIPFAQLPGHQVGHMAEGDIATVVPQLVI